MTRTPGRTARFGTLACFVGFALISSLLTSAAHAQGFFVGGNGGNAPGVWVDTDGTEYALAALDMDSFKNNMDKMKELNAKVRDTVRANADKAFDELSAEEAKRVR